MKNKDWRILYVFLSSTFRDMQTERDYICKKVIPTLNDRLSSYFIQIQVIDLRWGVNTSEVNEDEREASVLKVCLNEIKRTRPYFIGLLGDRYGWVPSEEQLSRILNRLNKDEKKLFANPYKQSVTALEIYFGAIGGKELLPHSFFFFRSPSSYSNLPEHEKQVYCDSHDPALSDEEKDHCITAQQELKKLVQTTLHTAGNKDHIKNYSIDLGNKSKEGIHELGNYLEELLYDDIINDYQLNAGQDNEEDTDIELEQFIRINNSRFCGRKVLLDDLENKIRNKDGIVLLTGNSGFGKSAIFCKLTDIFREKKKADEILLVHSAGVSSVSTLLEHIVDKWNAQLLQETGITYDTSDSSPVGKFKYLCKSAKEKGFRIFILLDSLDRMENSVLSQYAGWIEKGLHVFITSLPEESKNIVSLHPDSTVINLQSFRKEDVELFIHTAGVRNGKEIYTSVREELTKKRYTSGVKRSFFQALFSQNHDTYTHACQSPLWLTLACNILFNLDADDFNEISKLKISDNEEKIRSYLTELVHGFDYDPGKLFLQLIDKTGKDYGSEFVNTLFDLLVISKHGLNEKHLSELMGDLWDELSFAQLKRWFSGLITTQGPLNLNTISHTILTESVRERITPEKQKAYHRQIFNYLDTLNDKDPLKISSAVYHALKCRDEDHISMSLTGLVKVDNDFSDIATYIAEDPQENLDWILQLVYYENKNVNHSSYVGIKWRINTLTEYILPLIYTNYEKQIVTQVKEKMTSAVSESLQYDDTLEQISYIIDKNNNIIGNEKRTHSVVSHLDSLIQVIRDLIKGSKPEAVRTHFNTFDEILRKELYIFPDSEPLFILSMQRDSAMGELLWSIEEKKQATVILEKAFHSFYKRYSTFEGKDGFVKGTFINIVCNLLFVYEGTQQYQKAIDILENIEEILGGQKAIVKEYNVIHWLTLILLSQKEYDKLLPYLTGSLSVAEEEYKQNPSDHSLIRVQFYTLKHLVALSEACKDDQIANYLDLLIEKTKILALHTELYRVDISDILQNYSEKYLSSVEDKIEGFCNLMELEHALYIHKPGLHGVGYLSCMLPNLSEAFEAEKHYDRLTSTLLKFRDTLIHENRQLGNLTIFNIETKDRKKAVLLQNWLNMFICCSNLETDHPEKKRGMEFANMNYFKSINKEYGNYTIIGNYGIMQFMSLDTLIKENKNDEKLGFFADMAYQVNKSAVSTTETPDMQSNFKEIISYLEINNLQEYYKK